jgi:potassium-transporting ATPase KdpC subunit
VRTAVIALRMLIVTAVILGLIYPLAMTGAAQVLFPSKANGSVVKVNGTVIGSSLIGQGFTAPGYFHPRPSAAGRGYDAMSSSFSNLGPTSKVLRDRVRADVIAAVKANPGLTIGQVPIDMVTTSASGLDPDITIANARAQAPRVAAARNLRVPRVLALIQANTTGRQLGFLGEPRVNVLALNLALDQATGAPVTGP